MIPINIDPDRVARDLASWRRGEFAAGSPSVVRRWRTRRLMRAVSRNNRHDLERRIAEPPEVPLAQANRMRQARRPHPLARGE